MDTVTIWVMPLDYSDTPYAINEESDMRGNFNDLLDEMHAPVEIAGVMFYASRILEGCDPVAWREAFNNYCDSWTELEIPADLFYSAELDEINHWVAQELGADASVTDCVACASGEGMRHAYESPDA